FGKRDFIRYFCEAIQHKGVRLAWLTRRIDRDLLEAKDLVRLGRSRGQQNFTTVKIHKLERKLLTIAKALRESPGVKVSPKIINAVLRKYPTISADQERAVREFFANGCRL